jgi:uncharacterized membrane protein YoaK (UPF0700 family)
MTQYDLRLRTLATCLAGLAGYVDATGFLALGGFFVSFMSGNSTRLAVGAANGLPITGLAASLIVTFVLGVIAGALVAQRFNRRRRVAVMGLVSALLFVAAALNALGQTRMALVAMGLAMGAENAVFERDGEVSIGLTYMTGTLVKLGQRLAAALTGGSRTAWAPYLLLWAGLVAGAFLGAKAYASLGLTSLWLAASAATVLTVAMGLVDRGSRHA